MDNFKLHLSSYILNLQEEEVQNEFEQNYGKGANGICDNCLQTLNLIIQGIHYFKDDDQYDSNGNFKNFDQAIRFFGYLFSLRNSYSIKSIYNLISTGHYIDAATLIRTFLETLVRLKYIYKKRILI